MPRKKPEPSPAYLWYPKDVISSGRVAALKPLEELWYRRALDQSWLHDGLPADPEEFAGWVGRGCTTESAVKIIARFFIPHKKDGEKVVNERQEQERTKLFRNRRKKSDAGKESGRKRREAKALAGEQVLNTTRTKSNIPIPIPIPIPKKEKTIILNTDSGGTHARRAARPRSGTRIPTLWQASEELKQWASAKKLEVDLAFETEKFVNHYIGNGEIKADWDAMWKKWMLGTIEFNGNGKAPPDPDADCDRCDSERWIHGNIENWPCPKCRPIEYQKWVKRK